jgi:hypothetical protein
MSKLSGVKLQIIISEDTTSYRITLTNFFPLNKPATNLTDTITMITLSSKIRFEFFQKRFEFLQTSIMNQLIKGTTIKN